MSIQSKINKLHSILVDLTASISANGVNVPDGTKMDGIMDLLDEIWGNIAEAYAALAGLGAKMPELQNSQNLHDTILAIPVSHIFTEEADPDNNVGVDGDVYLQI